MAYDISHTFGSDLSFAATGDIATASGSTYVNQRVIRRLCTNLLAYTWQGNYGGGLPAQVGNTIQQETLAGIVTAQLALESGIDQTQPVAVNVVSNNVDSVSLTVQYTDASTGTVETAVVPIS